ncbi:hypothetical protein V499_00547 [Pseudogymnoascus sp. VKM F-103]|nr:hypothetical protein V499_00547 [Pseudogymnoascus sp. VKM F-103]
MTTSLATISNILSPAMSAHDLPAVDMPNKHVQESITEMQSSEFAKTILPLYSGAPVTIYIGSADNKFILPKAILSLRSPYFAAMFERGFNEGIEQTTTLELIDGIVTVRAFEILIQWLFTGQVTIKEATRGESISVGIEFSRLADMCGVMGTEDQVAERLRVIIRDGRVKDSWSYSAGELETNTQNITSEHIISASQLPHGHAVRDILAAASVEGYIQRKSHRFSEECYDIPEFAADLLLAVKETLLTLTMGEHTIEFKDPMSEERFVLYGSLPLDGPENQGWR